MSHTLTLNGTIYVGADKSDGEAVFYAPPLWSTGSEINLLYISLIIIDADQIKAST